MIIIYRVPLSHDHWAPHYTHLIDAAEDELDVPAGAEILARIETKPTDMWQFAEEGDEEE